MLYDGEYAGLSVVNHLSDTGSMKVSIDSAGLRDYHNQFRLNPGYKGGEDSELHAFPAALPGSYKLHIDVYNGPEETLWVSFGVNDGDQSVHVTIKENGEIELKKEDYPIAIPGL